jgi:hypothetical protein
MEANHDCTVSDRWVLYVLPSCQDGYGENLGRS